MSQVEYPIIPSSQPEEITPAVVPSTDERTGSYRRIFKSTSLVGGAQVANILIGVVRTKALAVLLGPSGMGLAGMFQSATGLVGTLTSFGISQAGVRQIAEAAGTGDEAKIARTTFILRRTALVSGILGVVVVLAFYRPLTMATFGNLDHAAGTALVSLTLLFGSLAAGQGALLQGLRRLKELALCTVLGGAFGTVASVLIVYFLRERGVALFLVAAAAFAVLPSWWFARKVRVQPVGLTWRQMVAEARGLLGMGLAFMVTALLGAGSAYLVRVLIIRELGMEAVGLYTATWTLSSLYVGLILGAMGADYYPRLTAVAGDDAAVNRMVNEQTEMGLLLAVPGILVTLSLAPYVLQVFYSAAFLPATGIIRWQILGIALRVVSWPLGFVLLAKGRARLFILTEGAAAVLQVALILVCMRIWGMEGIGLAFLFLYAAYTTLVLLVVRRLSDFAWTGRSWRLIMAGVLACALTLVAARLLPAMPAMAAGLVLAAISTAGSVFLLKRLLGVDLKQVLVRFFKK